MIEVDLLLVLRNKSEYDKYARFIKPSSLGEEAHNIFKAMGEWWKYNASALYIDWKTFASWFCLVRYAKMDKAKLDVYRAIFDRLETTAAPDPTAVKALMEGLATRDYAARIADKALRISDGDFTEDFGEIADLVDQRNTAIGKLETIDKHILLPTLSGLIESSAPGLKWRLGCLNDSCGDIRKGDFIVVGKRPDSGGTTLLASELTFMAPQLAPDEHILWCNNEEEGNKVFKRIVQSASAIPTAMLESNLPDALDKYAKVVGGHDKIIMLNKADLHVRDVEAVLKKYKVGLIVFDQLWKVHGFDAEAGNEVTRQTMLFNWAREVAKSYGPVIAVHQADGSAEGIKWIDMSKLYGSKTGVQGEADAIIMIGRLPDTGNTRYLFVPKNKLKGGDPALRNIRAEILIEPDVARFREY